jgi:uncharacterized protein YciI
MYVAILNYTKPEEQVALHRATHSAWVKKYIDMGVFLLAGPMTSKTGGVLFTNSIEKDKLQKIVNEDSYVISNVATYTLIEFDCKLAANDFEKLIGN